MSLAVQLEAFRALAEANRTILSRLRQGSVEGLDSLFEARRSLLERISEHPLGADPASAGSAEGRQALAQAQMEAARGETQIAEALAKIVPSNEKLGRYRQSLEAPKSTGNRWDMRG